MTKRLGTYFGSYCYIVGWNPLVYTHYKLDHFYYWRTYNWCTQNAKYLLVHYEIGQYCSPYIYRSSNFAEIIALPNFNGLVHWFATATEDSFQLLFAFTVKSEKKTIRAITIERAIKKRSKELIPIVKWLKAITLQGAISKILGKK